MKRLLTLVPIFLGLLVFPDSSLAQEYQGCYMLNSNGEQINLNGLCGNNSSTSTVTPGVFRAPIKRRHAGIPVIEVMFNGQHQVEMMVDTGATGTLLPPAIAQRLGVQIEGKVIANTPSDQGVEFPAGRVASVNAGGAVAKNLVVIIAPALSMGLLGQNFFGRYDMVIKEDVVEFRDR